MRWLIKTIYYTYTMRGTDKNTQKNLFCLCVSVFEYKNAKHAHTHFFFLIFFITHKIKMWQFFQTK